MRPKLISILYILCGAIGITRLFSVFGTGRIVTYHNVLPDEIFDDALHLGVSHRMSEFKAQVDLIRSRLKVTTDFMGSPGTCVITFDDGYKNNIAAAEYLE